MLSEIIDVYAPIYLKVSIYSRLLFLLVIAVDLHLRFGSALMRDPQKTCYVS
jgi:hypothetical protein